MRTGTGGLEDGRLGSAAGGREVPGHDQFDAIAIVNSIRPHRSCGA
jgi:hypothetical protein